MSIKYFVMVDGKPLESFGVVQTYSRLEAKNKAIAFNGTVEKSHVEYSEKLFIRLNKVDMDKLEEITKFYFGDIDNNRPMAVRYLINQKYLEMEQQQKEKSHGFVEKFPNEYTFDERR